MSLYIRLQASFWNHRKTARLFSAIGSDAYWLPPRLWTYAATNQPDGDFSGYTAEEIATVLNYKPDASSMLQALQAAGFMDGMLIHDWSEHNGYHAAFSSRAKKAAAARWKKERTKERTSTRKERKRKEQALLEHAPSMQVLTVSPEDIYKAYPLKVGRPEALRAIKKQIARHDSSLLLERTYAFAKARAGNLDFCPHPATWFNQERFNDDPATWSVSTAGHNGFHRAKTPDPRQQKLDREYEEAQRKYGSGNKS